PRAPLPLLLHAIIDLPSKGKLHRKFSPSPPTPARKFITDLLHRRSTPTCGPPNHLSPSLRTTFRSVAVVGHQSQVFLLGAMTTFILPKPTKWVNVWKLLQANASGVL
ncbi:unnamed protein product, partial [Urochloa humidicola]